MVGGCMGCSCLWGGGAMQRVRGKVSGARYGAVSRQVLGYQRWDKRAEPASRHKAGALGPLQLPGPVNSDTGREMGTGERCCRVHG